MKLESIKPANDGKHKYTAVFSDPKKTTHFGAIGYTDFTKSKDEQKKEELTYNRQDFWETTSNKQLNFVQHICTLTFPVKSKIQQCKHLDPLSGKALRNNSLDRRK